jgi:hypothetical protein
MNTSDKRVVWYAAAGAGGILLLLVGAILVSRLVSGGSEPSTVGDEPDTPVATADDGDAMGRSGVAESSRAASGDAVDRPDTQSRSAATSPEFTGVRPDEPAARTAASEVSDRPAGPAGETATPVESKGAVETPSHSPVPAADAPIGKTFADLADNERKAFLDDLNARLIGFKQEAKAAAEGGSREAMGLLLLKVKMTTFVVLADHAIQPTEFPRLAEYGFDKGWIREGEFPISRDAIAQARTAQTESLSPTDEELLKVIANISLDRRKTIIDEFNGLYAKYCDPAHKRDLARGLIALQTKYGLTSDQLGAIRLDAADRGWTVLF